MRRLSIHGVSAALLRLSVCLSFGHEATIEHLMLVVLLCHGCLDVVREPSTSASTVFIIASLRRSLMLDQVVIGLVLLGASDLVQDVCVDMRR